MGLTWSSKSRAKTSKIERRMAKALRRKILSDQNIFKSFDGILMKFPKIDKSFEQVRDVFTHFDKDQNGTLNLEELKCCFKELHIHVTDKETLSYYHESELASTKGITFKEFIIVLAIVYLLGKSADQGTSQIGMPELETSLEMIMYAFVFFDENRDGYVTKKEMAHAITGSSGEHSGKIGVKRFEEIDWDKNGKITFKEFLFAFTGWVGVDDDNCDD